MKEAATPLLNKEEVLGKVVGLATKPDRVSQVGPPVPGESTALFFPLDTAELRIFAVWSLRFWVSGYITKWRIQGQFWKLVFTLVKRQNLGKKLNILSLDTFR